MNALYLRRRLKVAVPAQTSGTEPAGGMELNVIAGLQKNLEDLGFLLSLEVCEALRGLSAAKLKSFYQDVVSAILQMVGAHREFRPMYPNFPDQVMEMSQAQLYWNAIAHYCTNRVQPFEKMERAPLGDTVEPKIIGLGGRADFEQMFTLMASAKTSLSLQDKEDVVWFVRQYRDDIVRLLPEKTPSRENMALLGAALVRNTSLAPAWLSGRVNVVTDVLRLAVALSGGDVSLAAPSKFTRFSRSERRLLLGLVEQCTNATEDMLRWKDRWVRLGERLHPGEYAKSFPKTCAAFDILRNDRPFESFNASIERHLASGNAAAAAALLQTRPGELTRRLDHLLRTAKEPGAVVSAFRSLAAKVSTPVLMQAMTHFARRDEPQEWRTFFPKGEVAKVQVIPGNLPSLPGGSSVAISSICEETLVARFAALPPLGRCYLDPRLADYLVPFSQRSASKALRTLVRGSRLPLPQCKVLRFFIWWRNGSGRTDIDLSAAVFDSNLKYVGTVAYYNPKGWGGCHSGDIVDAPQGAAEFIDMDVRKTVEAGGRYIVMCLNSFTMQPYCDLPECFAGWMARQEAGSGEIFEPRTVQNKVDVASNSRICLPAIFDLCAQQVIWADIALKGSPRWNNVRNNLSGVSLMLRAILGLRKTSLHTLFDLHIAAHGSLVSDPQDADTVFSIDKGITPFDLDRIADGYL